MIQVIERQDGHWPSKVAFSGDADEAGRVFRDRLSDGVDVAMYDDTIVPLGIDTEVKSLPGRSPPKANGYA